MQPGEFRGAIRAVRDRGLDVNRRQTFGAPMDELPARLEAILRRYATSYDQPDDREQFRKGLELLVAEYGPQAVTAALDEVPTGPSVYLH